MLRWGLVVFAGFILTNVATAQNIDREGFKNLWEASFGYYCAARVCGNSETIKTAENTLLRVLNYGDFHNLLPNAAVKFKKNPKFYIQKGEKTYRYQQWVSCDQVRHYVRELDQATRHFE